MPSYLHIEEYRAKLQELIEFGGSDNEENIRPAFQNCLDAYCRDHRERLVLIPELRTSPSNKPDGTVKDSLRMARGYWEAKDSHDDLDAEIQAKFNRGYPTDNIIFEDSQTAVLVQNASVAMRVDMSRDGELHRLIRVFLDYELPEIQEFRQAQSQFKTDLPTVLENLRATVAEAEAENQRYQEAASAFLVLCRRTIGPAVSPADVREMLLQHILTKDIFQRVFAEDQFHRENNVARQLDGLEGTFFTGDVRRQAIDRLRAYYGVIGRAADEIADYAEKQQFLKAIYEDFYTAYNPAAADRLEHKYLNEIHANEVAILPYYIANLNIEYTYQQRMGRYLEFPNLCFVDTLDNLDWQGATGAAVTRQGAFNLGGLSEENWIRIQEQNEKPISVIIGNPPYNDSAKTWGDDSDNRGYLEIDQRIQESYVKEGTAQRTHQYDMYKRFIRWASDRLADDGIIGFVSNNAFLDAQQDDGFRKVIAQEFNELWVLNLKGNARTSGERRRRESGNVFNNKIRVGIAVYFLVRSQGLSGFRIFYHSIDDYVRSQSKVDYVKATSLTELGFDEITPDAKNNWLNQSNSNFAQLTALANRQAKLRQYWDSGVAVFGLVTPAVKSNRDGWVYDFDAGNLQDKTIFFADTYNQFVEKQDGSFDPVIKWSDSLRDSFHRGETIVYDDGNRVESLWRPFVKKWYLAEPVMNDRLTGNHYELFGGDLRRPNQVINFCTNGKEFYVLATARLSDFHFTGDTQCLPLYHYTEDRKQVSNITDWGLRHFRERYGDDSITAKDVFAYTYGVLHDPVYLEKYAIDLLRQFPRLPFYPEFWDWVKMGQQLLELHIGFESAEPYPLQTVEQAGEAKRVTLRADMDEGRIILDDVTTLAGVPTDAWRYRLGNRSALEWVLDQYKERKPRDPTIAAKFNTYKFADYKEHVIDLLRRVCTVSVATMEVVDGMTHLERLDLLAEVGHPLA